MSFSKFFILAIALATTIPAFAQDQGASTANDAIVTSIQEQMGANNVECTPRLNIGSNLFYSMWRGELKIGFRCEEKEGNARIQGDVILKGERIRGCDDAAKARLLARIPVAPIGSECKTDDRGRETFEAMFIKRLSFEVVFF